METIGDSPLVEPLVVDERSKELEKDSIEFEQNCDVFKMTLEKEEEHLTELDDRRSKILDKIEQLYLEVLEENDAYRKAIDNVIKEHQKLSRYFIDSCEPLTAVDFNDSTTSLLDECCSTIEPCKVDSKIDLDMEKIRCDLMENYILTKENYLSTVKDQIQQKQLKLSTQLDEQSTLAE
jgi:hypothetical protein